MILKEYLGIAIIILNIAGFSFVAVLTVMGLLKKRPEKKSASKKTVPKTKDNAALPVDPEFPLEDDDILDDMDLSEFDDLDFDDLDFGDED